MNQEVAMKINNDLNVKSQNSLVIYIIKGKQKTWLLTPFFFFFSIELSSQEVTLSVWDAWVLSIPSASVIRSLRKLLHWNLSHSLSLQMMPK